MELFDSHCHLDVEEFDADRDAVLARARAAGVRSILVPGVRASRWGGLLELCARERGLYPALGLHPVYLEAHAAGDIAALEAVVAASRPAAIGEIGLDLHLRELDPGRQQALFEAQLGIARDAGLPVALHVRKAHEPVLRALASFRVPGGFAHAFNGSPEQARRYIDLGFKLGFGGMLTFERSSRLRRLAVELPLEAIVLETDAPDLSVASHRGERNSPEYLPEVLATLAGLRGEPPEAVAAVTTRNAREVLALGRAA